MAMHCLYCSDGSLQFLMWIKYGLLKILLNCAMLHFKVVLCVLLIKLSLRSVH